MRRQVREQHIIITRLLDTVPANKQAANVSSGVHERAQAANKSKGDVLPDGLELVLEMLAAGRGSVEVRLDCETRSTQKASEQSSSKTSVQRGEFQAKKVRVLIMASPRRTILQTRSKRAHCKP